MDKLLHCSPHEDITWYASGIELTEFDAGTRSLEIVQIIETGGAEPRNFALDPSGAWLLVGNQNSDTITVLARDAATGRLTATGNRIETASPVCLLFVAEA